MMKDIRKFTLALLILIWSAPLAAEESHLLANGDTVVALDFFQECDVCPEMIVLPLGSFMMGAREGESWSSLWADWGEQKGPVGHEGPDGLYNLPNEGPQHRVLMDTAYATGVNEVTYAEWMVCVNDGGCHHNPDHSALHGVWVQLGPDHPAIDVSFLDIKEYVVWLNARVGMEVYRLPTEAEWEYAARAGTMTRFAQGDVLTSDQANFSGETTEHNRGRPFPDLLTRGLPVPVDTLDAANPWGLRHMSGNVYEITLSCYTDRHLGLPTNSAYLADAAQGCERYVAKGGSYGMAMDAMRLAHRTLPSNDYRREFYGFRLIRIFPNSEAQ